MSRTEEMQANIPFKTNETYRGRTCSEERVRWRKTMSGSEKKELKMKTGKSCWQLEIHWEQFCEEAIDWELHFYFLFPRQVYFWYSKGIELWSATCFFVCERIIWYLSLCFYLPSQIKTNYLGKLKKCLNKCMKWNFTFLETCDTKRLLVYILR